MLFSPVDFVKTGWEYFSSLLWAVCRL